MNTPKTKAPTDSIDRDYRHAIKLANAIKEKCEKEGKTSFTFGELRELSKKLYIGE